MRVGTENKKTTVTAVALLAGAALLFYRDWRAPSFHPPPSMTPAVRPSANPAVKPRSRTDHRYVAYLLKPTLDPHLRLDLLAGSEGVAYEGSGHDIFVEHAEEIPQPSAPGLLDAKQFVPPPPPPPPAPINLKFWGWASRPGEAKAVFLAQGDNGFVAHEGEIIARRYKVVKIGPSWVEIEDMLSNQRQNIAVAF